MCSSGEALRPRRELTRLALQASTVRVFRSADRQPALTRYHRRCMIIRPLQPGEEPAIGEVLLASRLFADDEIDAALAQARAFVSRGGSSDYQLFVSEDRERLAGFVSIGPTPRHQGVYDLYWIAVAPADQGRGIGSLLLWFAEDWARGQGGTTILIETWSGDAFASTRRFYQRRGYTEESRVIDFRRARNDRIILSKIL